MQKNILSIIMLCFCIHVHGQDVSQDDVRVFYGDEVSGSIGVHTNGFSVGARHAKRKTAFLKNFYEFQIQTISHPKEVRISSDYGGKYVYGKNNSVFTLLFTVGRQNEKFSKLDRGSVSVRYLRYAGLSLAFEKPYYYANPQDKKDYFLFNDSTSAARALRAPYFKGFSELSVVPGIILGVGIHFEFSNRPSVIQLIELGGNVQVYTRKINIMHTDSNNFIFPSMYIAYRYGKILSVP